MRFDNETYARKIELLIALNGSQQKLAKALGTSQKQISRWANGKEPGYKYRHEIDKLYYKRD